MSDEQKCPRCDRSTLVNGTVPTAEIWWSRVGWPDDSGEDRAECDRVTVERIASLRAELARRPDALEVERLVKRARAEGMEAAARVCWDFADELVRGDAAERLASESGAAQICAQRIRAAKEGE